MNDIPNPAPIGAAKPRKRRGLRVAVVLSLMLNVLMIGVLAGGAWRVSRLETAMSQPDVRALWRAMPDHARSALRGAAHAAGEGDDRAERRARALETGRQLIEALRTEPFDPAHFAALLGQDRESHVLRLDAAHRALAEQIAALSAAERDAMAARLSQSRPLVRRNDRP